MKRVRSFILVWIATSLQATPLSDWRYAEQWATVMKHAEERSDTRIGHDYAERFVRATRHAFIDAMRTCAGADTNPSDILDLAFVVTADGRIKRSFIVSTNSFGGCVGEHLRLPESVPKPPRDGWPMWIRVVNGSRSKTVGYPDFTIFSR